MNIEFLRVVLNSCRKLGASTLHSEAIQYVVKTSIRNFRFCFFKQPTFKPYDGN
ncbi:MAG: hypothetical protein ACKESC_00160 [Candidatus Hodgkinia cicadicola]